MTKSAETADLVKFTEEILNGNLPFLCSAKLCLCQIDLCYIMWKQEEDPSHENESVCRCAFMGNIFPLKGSQFDINVFHAATKIMRREFCKDVFMWL